MPGMQFDVFGRYELEVERSDRGWVAYRRGEGTRREDPTIFIPAELSEGELEAHLEDLLHEQASPGTSVRRIR